MESPVQVMDNGAIEEGAPRKHLPFPRLMTTSRRAGRDQLESRFGMNGKRGEQKPGRHVPELSPGHPTNNGNCNKESTETIEHAQWPLMNTTCPEWSVP